MKEVRLIKARRLTQEDAFAQMGIDQSEVSRIARGQLSGVSDAKLMELVARLGQNIKIVVYPVLRRAGRKEKLQCAYKIRMYSCLPIRLGAGFEPIFFEDNGFVI